jgi:two-component system, sensor histidine kinase FlrB
MSAINIDSGDAKRGELQAAFRAFGSASSQLSGAFDALRGQLAELRAELAEAHVGKEHLAARLAALVHSLPGGVLVLDARGAVVEVNPAGIDLLGEPLIGESWQHILQRCANPGASPEHTELRNGRFVNISRREMEIGGEVVLLTDVTEAHFMQGFLARQQRLLTLGELAAGLAHQIRTPLATALLYASQMTLPDRSREDLNRCGERTVDSLRQLDRLLNDMLAFAHGGAARESVSVSALLEQVAQWLRPALRRGVRLTIRTQAPNLKIRANASSLVSVVLNLATNALQAAVADLDLELLGRRADGRAHIVVSDNGPGIPEAVRRRLFEPFFTTRERGNGLGLSIVKSVVEAHGGHVRLLETGPGATFVIDLPEEVTA